MNNCWVRFDVEKGKYFELLFSPYWNIEIVNTILKWMWLTQRGSDCLHIELNWQLFDTRHFLTGDGGDNNRFPIGFIDVPHFYT